MLEQLDNPPDAAAFLAVMLVVTHIHEHDGDGQADAQVVPVRFLYWQDEPRQQQEDAADGSNNTQPARNEADGLEAVRIHPVSHGARQAARQSLAERLADPAFCICLAISDALGAAWQEI